MHQGGIRIRGRADKRLDVNRRVCRLMGVKRASFAKPERSAVVITDPLDLAAAHRPVLDEFAIFVVTNVDASPLASLPASWQHFGFIGHPISSCREIESLILARQMALIYATHGTANEICGRTFMEQ